MVSQAEYCDTMTQNIVIESLILSSDQISESKCNDGLCNSVSLLEIVSHNVGMKTVSHNIVMKSVI